MTPRCAQTATYRITVRKQGDESAGLRHRHRQWAFNITALLCCTRHQLHSVHVGVPELTRLFHRWCASQVQCNMPNHVQLDDVAHCCAEVRWQQCSFFAEVSHNRGPHWAFSSSSSVESASAWRQGRNCFTSSLSFGLYSVTARTRRKL